MSQSPKTPEEVIGELSYREVQELLAEISMDSSLETAVRMKRLVQRLGRFEAAVEALGGQARMTTRSDSRRAA